MPIQDLFRGEFLSTARPTIATLHADPDPRGGTVNVTQFTNSFVVTYRNVPDFPYWNPASALNTFRTSLFSNGQIMMEYNNTILSGKSLPKIGISPGGNIILNTRLNPVDFSSGSLTGFGPLDAIFETFNNPAALGVSPRSISHATLSVPGFPTTTVVGNFGQTSFTSCCYLGTSPVTGNSFNLVVVGGAFTLTNWPPITGQSGAFSYAAITPNTGTLSITSITSDTIPAGEFKFAAGQNIPVAITDRPVLDLLNATLIFTPNAVSGYDVAFIPTAPAIPASPSS